MMNLFLKYERAVCPTLFGNVHVNIFNAPANLQDAFQGCQQVFHALNKYNFACILTYLE